MNRMLRWFAFARAPKRPSPSASGVMTQYADLTADITELLPEGPDLLAVLRTTLEAEQAFDRAVRKQKMRAPRCAS